MSTLVVSAAALAAAGDAGPVHEQGDVAERLVLHDARLAPDVLLAEIVPVVRAHDHGRALPQPALVQRREDLTDPMVDHAELGAVVGPDVPPLALAQSSLGHRADVVGRPDEQLALPAGVVAPAPRLGRVEGLVRVELVHEQQEGCVVGGAAAQPVGRGSHRPRTGEVLLAPEERARSVVGPVACRPAEPLAQYHPPPRAGSAGAPM